MQTHTHVCSRALWGQPLMWPSAHPAWHLITALSVSHPAQWLHVLELLSLQPLSSLYSITSSILCTSVQYATFQTALSPCGSTECWVNFYLCFMIIGPELSPGVLLLFAIALLLEFSNQVPRQPHLLECSMLHPIGQMMNGWLTFVIYLCKVIFSFWKLLTN